MRTEQDKINRKEANQRYYRLEENKQQKRDYMKEYIKRPYVREKYLAKLKKRNWTMDVNFKHDRLKKNHPGIVNDDPNNHEYE